MNSIITKRGDNGYTDCLYNQRMAKSSLLIEAIGNIDELGASIGFSNKNFKQDGANEIQTDLIALMGELSAGPHNFERYKKDFGKVISKEDVKKLEDAVHNIEKHCSFSDWAKADTYWDQSCRICRRAERTLWRYSESYNKENFHLEKDGVRQEVHQYINRLSDLLWSWGRHYEV